MRFLLLELILADYLADLNSRLVVEPSGQILQFVISTIRNHLDIYSRSSNIYTCMYTQAIFKLRVPYREVLSIYI